jgi:hypothetical protein
MACDLLKSSALEKGIILKQVQDDYYLRVQDDCYLRVQDDYYSYCQDDNVTKRGI